MTCEACEKLRVENLKWASSREGRSLEAHTAHSHGLLGNIGDCLHKESGAGRSFGAVLQSLLSRLMRRRRCRTAVAVAFFANVLGRGVSAELEYHPDNGERVSLLAGRVPSCASGAASLRAATPGVSCSCVAGAAATPAARASPTAVTTRRCRPFLFPFFSVLQGTMDGGTSRRRHVRISAPFCAAAQPVPTSSLVHSVFSSCHRADKTPLRSAGPVLARARVSQ